MAFIEIPHNLAEAVVEADGPRRAWMESLSGTVERLAQMWSLVVGDPFQPGGQTAWVAPGRTTAGVDVVLKVGWRHDEALHEADALREWNGHGAVKLHDVTGHCCVD